MANISVIGAGSWGGALALLLNKNGHNVNLWSALQEEVDTINNTRENPSKLPGVRFPQAITVTSDLELSMRDKDLLVLAVPSNFTRQTAHSMAEFLKPGQLITNVAKGIEEGTLLRLSQVISQELPSANISVLSGPTHAEEVAIGIPTSIVAGARDKNTAEYVQSIFMNEFFRVYTSPDMLGIELGGALKNVIALAAGAADGLGGGDNTKAALITRGIAEISRLGLKMGANLQTIGGLSGMGDLIVTCASMHSRNRRAGILIGKGYSYEAAMAEVKQVVEGVFSAKAAKGLGEKYQVELPIIDQVNEVLFNNKKAADALRDLMLRDRKIEITDSEWEL